VSVLDAAVHEVPFHTPTCNPTIWAAFGESATIVAVSDPRLEMLNACVKAPFFDNVPEKVSVTGLDGVGAVTIGVLLHALIARMATNNSSARREYLSMNFLA
jgi:hypothetical protein